ncbi:unnamed protein product [Arctogadus glacialis]
MSRQSLVSSFDRYPSDHLMFLLKEKSIINIQECSHGTSTSGSLRTLGWRRNLARITLHYTVMGRVGDGALGYPARHRSP